MTKKKLNWKLKQLPNASDVANLVANGVISKEEAKELLFNDKDAEDQEKEALREQVEFLKDIIKSLQTQKPTYIDYHFNSYTPQRYWKPLEVWCTTTLGQNISAEVGSTGRTYSMSSTAETIPNNTSNNIN